VERCGLVDFTTTSPCSRVAFCFLPLNPKMGVIVSVLLGMASAFYGTATKYHMADAQAYIGFKKSEDMKGRHRWRCNFSTLGS